MKRRTKLNEEGRCGGRASGRLNNGDWIGRTPAGFANPAPLNRSGWRKMNGGYGRTYRKMTRTANRARVIVRIGMLVGCRDRLYSHETDE
jgi:hypothetical protein